MLKGINSTPDGKTKAGQDSKALAKGLGRAGAHEVSHYLLQQIKHSGSGVMKKGFGGADWFHRSTRYKWTFSDDQKKKIRARLPAKPKSSP